MKATRLRLAANTKLEAKGAMSQDDQLGQRISKISLLIVTNLATDMILGTEFVNVNIEKISPRKAHCSS